MHKILLSNSQVIKLSCINSCSDATKVDFYVIQNKLTSLGKFGMDSFKKNVINSYFPICYIWKISQIYSN